MRSSRKISSWKSVVSYLLPVKVETVSSAVSGKVDIWLVNGRCMIDTEQANYSFGSLHKLFREVFRKTGFRNFPTGELLLLGLGGGSVPHILYGELKLDLPVTAVEIDPLMIRLAKDYFGAEEFPQLRIIQQDALGYLHNTDRRYATIVVDVFIDNRVPEPFTQEPFLEMLVAALTEEGRIYMNLITEEEHGKLQAEQVKSILHAHGGRLAEYPVAGTNTVLFWTR